MKKSSLKIFSNFANENSQKQNDLRKKENSKEGLLIRCNKNEGYIKTNKQLAVKKFQSLQKFKNSNKQGKCIFSFSYLLLVFLSIAFKFWHNIRK